MGSSATSAVTSPGPGGSTAPGMSARPTWPPRTVRSRERGRSGPRRSGQAHLVEERQRLLEQSSEFRSTLLRLSSDSGTMSCFVDSIPATTGYSAVSSAKYC